MHPKLRRLREHSWLEQSEAIRLARHLQKQLPAIESQLRQASAKSLGARRDVARRLAELEHAALELAGLGVAHADGRTRWATPRQCALIVLLVQKAAEAFAEKHRLLARELPDPDAEDVPEYPGAYPCTLVTTVRTHLGSALQVTPSLSAKIGADNELLVEGLVYAVAVRARALALGKTRSAYLGQVALALCRVGLVKKADVSSLEKQVERYL